MQQVFSSTVFFQRPPIRPSRSKFKSGLIWAPRRCSRFRRFRRVWFRIPTKGPCGWKTHGRNAAGGRLKPWNTRLFNDRILMNHDGLFLIIYNIYINFHEIRFFLNPKISALISVQRLDFWNGSVWVASNQDICFFFRPPNHTDIS